MLEAVHVSVEITNIWIFFGNHYGLCCLPLPVVEEMYKRKLRDKRKRTFQSFRSFHAVPQLDSLLLSVNLTNVHWHAVKPVAPIPTCVFVCVEGVSSG